MQDRAKPLSSLDCSTLVHLLCAVYKVVICIWFFHYSAISSSYFISFIIYIILVTTKERKKTNPPFLSSNHSNPPPAAQVWLSRAGEIGGQVWCVMARSCWTTSPWVGWLGKTPAPCLSRRPRDPFQPIKEIIDGNTRKCQEKSDTMSASISTETRKAFRNETFKKLLGNQHSNPLVLQWPPSLLVTTPEWPALTTRISSTAKRRRRNPWRRWMGRWWCHTTSGTTTTGKHIARTRICWDLDRSSVRSWDKKAKLWELLNWWRFQQSEAGEYVPACLQHADGYHGKSMDLHHRAGCSTSSPPSPDTSIFLAPFTGSVQPTPGMGTPRDFPSSASSSGEMGPCCCRCSR